MAGTERNRTEQEVILAPGTTPLASLEELTEACLPTLTARLWATCCWPATMAGGWKIGDHNFLIAEVRPDPETCLYVQFWSEPHEPVDAEVCSGEWNPGAVKYVRQPQRDGLTALGYTVGGRAHNFRKELQIRDVGRGGDGGPGGAGHLLRGVRLPRAVAARIEVAPGRTRRARARVLVGDTRRLREARRAPRVRDRSPRQARAGRPPAAREEAVPRGSRRPYRRRKPLLDRGARGVAHVAPRHR